ncbi:MAG: insulinase family protein, partial [Planctomycetota bacterium]
LVVGNGVLGSFPHSKLFVNVREGASLCYYASSFLERSQAMMFISSGIELARFEEARDLIGVQIADVAAGRFSDEELTATKVALESRLRMIDDSPAALMDIDLSWLLNGVAADLTEYRRRIAAVTREDVVAAFAKVRPDVIYLLAPEEPVPSGEEASS